MQRWLWCPHISHKAFPNSLFTFFQSTNRHCWSYRAVYKRTGTSFESLLVWIATCLHVSLWNTWYLWAFFPVYCKKPCLILPLGINTSGVDQVWIPETAPFAINEFSLLLALSPNSQVFPTPQKPTLLNSRLIRNGKNKSIDACFTSKPLFIVSIVHLYLPNRNPFSHCSVPSINGSGNWPLPVLSFK